MQHIFFLIWLAGYLLMKNLQFSLYSRPDPGLCSIQGPFEVNGVIIRTLNIQHAALTVLLTLNQLRLHKLPDIQYIHIHTAPQQAFTLLLVRRFICGDKREWTAVQQCVSVSTRTWWGTGVLKWLPDGASIININLRSLLSCTFSIQLIMLI